MNRLLPILFCLGSLIANAQIPDYVPIEGLMAWYPFNGDANDESDLANHGIVFGATLTSDRFGVTNSAYHFDGNDHIEAPHQNWLNAGTGSKTWAGWGRKTSGNDHAHFLTKIDATSGPYSSIGSYLRFAPNQVIEFAEGESGNGGNSISIQSSSLMNQWVHLAGVKDSISGTMRIYQNGVLMGESPFQSSQSFDNSGPLFIGCEHPYVNLPSGPQYFFGDLDDLGIWDRALTEEEILALYDAETPIPGCTNPDACNFDELSNIDDGSCIPSGCMDEQACNYNPEAGCAGEDCDYCSCVGDFHMGVSFSYPIVSFGSNQYYTPWGGVDLGPIQGTVVTQFEGGEEYFLALKADSTVEVLCSGCSGIHESLADSKFIDVDGGRHHWAFVRADGTLGPSGGTDVAPEVDDAVACARSWYFMMGLRENGEIVGWGGGWHPYPGELPTISAIDAGIWHAVALTTEGQVIEWGYEDSSGETLTSNPEILAMEGIVDISAGSNYTLAIFQDGSAKVWTWPDGNIIHDIPASEGVVDGGVNWAIFSYITYDGRVVTMNNQGLQSEQLDVSPQIECGRCIYDFNGNGVCNEGAILGCIDLTACNYSTEATIDDGSCIPSGCLDEQACNYNSEAQCDGETCDYTCCPGPGCCGDGTAWNFEAHSCVPLPCDSIPDASACGPGTYWDSNTARCLPETLEICLGDLSLDGFIGVEDLLQLLVLFGYPCEPIIID